MIKEKRNHKFEREWGVVAWEGEKWCKSMHVYEILEDNFKEIFEKKWEWISFESVKEGRPPWHQVSEWEVIILQLSGMAYKHLVTETMKKFIGILISILLSL